MVCGMDRTPDPKLPAPVELDPRAARIIERAISPIPAYRSAEWHALPAASVERMAAVFVAAEAWHDMHRPERIAERVAAEWWIAERARHESWRQASEAVRVGLQLPHTWSENGTASD